MKKLNALSYLLFLMLVTMTGCEVIGDIFGAGVYTGVFLVVLIIVVIIVIVSRIGRRK